MQTTRLWAVAAAAFTVMGWRRQRPRSIPNRRSSISARPRICRPCAIAVTVALKLRNTDQLESLLQSTYTPGGAGYRRFLNAQEFGAKFGPTPETIARVHAAISRRRDSRSRSSTATHLSVSGTAAAIQSEFAVELHASQVGPTSAGAGYNSDSPLRAGADPCRHRRCGAERRRA